MALPYIVFVTSEGCGACLSVKKGGTNSPYYKAVQVARTYGNVVIINTESLGERPELPYVPNNFYNQLKEYPSVFVFSNEAWKELSYNINIMGYRVRDWATPGALAAALTNVGYQPAPGGQLYDNKLLGGDTDALTVLHGVTKTPEGFKSPVSNEITHIKAGGNTMTLKEYIVYFSDRKM